VIRTFSLSLASSSTAYNLLSLILGTTGAVPTDGYFPNPCNALDLKPTGSDTVTVMDSATGSGPSSPNSAPFSLRYLNNVIDLSKIYVKGSSSPTTVTVLVGAT